jgi:integrase
VTLYDRWHKTERQPDAIRKQVRSSEYGCEKRWQVRWRDEQGRQKKRAFVKKIDAQRYGAKVKTQLADGTYIDESAGQVSFRAYAEDWRVARMHDPSTAERVESMLRNHVYSYEGKPGRIREGGPAIGDYPMRALAKRTQLLQGWIKGLTLGPNSSLLVIGYVSQVFTAAVEEGLIARNPLSAKSIQKPAAVKTEAIPWTAAEIDAVAGELPGWLRVAPYIGSAFGTRQGEALGLAKSDVDFLRKTVRIAVQVKVVGGRMVFAPVKNKKPREVPMAEPVIPRMSEHMRRFPPVPVTLPWHEPGNPKRHGKPVTRELILTWPPGQPVQSEAFNRPWRAAWKRAGIPDRGRLNGFHATRHTFASACLSDGLNPAKVAALIGDTLQVTLATYSHFLPDDDDRAKEILGRFFRSAERSDQGACAPDVPKES